MRRECRERFPRHRLQRKPLVSDPGMHHGTCVTHVPWCMSGSLARVGGENVPGITGTCATRTSAYLTRGLYQKLQLQAPKTSFAFEIEINWNLQAIRLKIVWRPVLHILKIFKFKSRLYQLLHIRVQRFKGLKPHWAYLPPSFDHNIHIHDDLIIGKTVLVQAMGIFMHGLWRKYVTCEIKTSSFTITVILISQNLLRRDRLDTPSLIWRGFNINLRYRGRYMIWSSATTLNFLETDHIDLIDAHIIHDFVTSLITMIQ